MPGREWIIRAAALAFLYAGAPAQAAVYLLPRQDEDLVGAVSSALALPGDNLAILAHRYGLGFRQLIRANPHTDPWSLSTHKPLKLPTALLLPRAPRRGIVVNVSEMRLYYYPAGKPEVWVYPVAVGRVDWKTPLGKTQVRAKSRDPVWYPPESIRAEHAAKGDPLPREVPPGPDNPLGGYALRLGWSDILIHGTNMPLGGIGMPVTHGCIRMYPKDIQTMYEQVPVGTAVSFIDEPYKLGRHAGRWYVEAHAPLAENPHALPTAAQMAPALVKLKEKLIPVDETQPDWKRVEALMRQASGLPEPLRPLAAPLPAGGALPGKAAATR